MKEPLIAFYMHALFNGGIERVVFNLATQFIAKGIHVDLVVNKAGWSPLADQIPNGVRLVDLGAETFLVRPIRLIGYLRRERPQVVLSSNHFSNEIAVLSEFIARTGTRVVVWEHTTLSVELRKLRATSLRRLGVPVAARLAYRRAHRIVAVSQGAANDLVEFLGLAMSDVSTVYNPILTPEIQHKAREAVNHPWLNADQPPVVLGIGRLEPQKDFANLLNAFKQVRAAMPARLIILGEGSLRPELAQQIRHLGIEGDVDLPGFVTNPFAYLAKAKVFVLSSAWEGLPTVLVEAMAVGTPVVSTDCRSGPAEILDGGRFGALVPIGRPEMLGRAILAVLTGDAATEPSGDWLRQFKSDFVAERYLEILGIDRLKLSAPV
jgi:glycosyltransferase involved in cell wall biosynthesis